MPTTHTGEELVLAVFPTSRGFGYAVFEGPLGPVDWGVKEVRGDKNRQSLERIRELIEWFRPDAIVLEHCGGSGSHRSDRVKCLVQGLKRLARRYDITIQSYSRAQMRAYFSRVGAVTKYEIAKAVAGQLPELEPWLPPPRKLWMSEDPRLSIFDAVALAFMFFYSDPGPGSTPAAKGRRR